MHPPFSVVFLTTLIGAGQGLFLALFTAQAYSTIDMLPAQDPVTFYALGSVVALLFLAAGLVAAFFHLGRPERAWRAATMWRTSWMSREVIVLPAFMMFVFIYGALNFLGWNPNLLGEDGTKQTELIYLVGLIGVVVCFGLFISTGMIYACLKFLEEWHTPLTPINYILLGTASGFMLATVFAGYAAPELVKFFGLWAIVLTAIALIFRAASLVRNHRIKHKSNLQTAIGIKHVKIQQKAMGAMGGTFNTREFFHGKTAMWLKSIKWIFLALSFPVPVLLVLIGLGIESINLLLAAFVVQYLGLIAERWFFFAQVKHPQNLYYQTV